MAGFGLDIIGNALAGKPTIPTWNTIDLGGQQTKAISENQASLPALENLAGQYNQFTTDQMQKLLGQVIPDFNNIKSGITSKIDSYLKGEIPADVSSAINSSSAARALTGGFGGSGMAGNLTAKDLGLTSLNLIDKGISTAQSWIGQMGQMLSPRLLDVSSMFVTPQQQFEDTFQNQESQFQRDYVSNMNDWQHSLGYAAGQDVKDTGAFILSMFGGMMGGGGGMGKGGSGGGQDLSGGDNGSTGSPSFGGFN